VEDGADKATGESADVEANSEADGDADGAFAFVVWPWVTPLYGMMKQLHEHL